MMGIFPIGAGDPKLRSFMGWYISMDPCIVLFHLRFGGFKADLVLKLVKQMVTDHVINLIVSDMFFIRGTPTTEQLL